MMHAHCRIRDRKAKPCSAYLTGMRLVNAVEPLKYAVQILLWNTDTRILHLDDEIRIIRIE